MQNLDHIYDRSFFEEWGPTHERYIRSAEIISKVLQETYQPKRLIDLGCGCGIYSHLFAQNGVVVQALDGVQPPSASAFSVPIHLQDLTIPFKSPWGPFDLALCLEVAEHIPETDLDVFLQNITQFSDRLILSAAPPGQGGHHHVNEQPKRYWVRELGQRGFIYNRKETGQLFERLNAIKLPYMWMGAHISVYDRTAPFTRVRHDIPFAVRIN